MFWKDLLNATFIYTWSFTPENDYQAVSLSLCKHFIKTYILLCWLHPSCTTIYMLTIYICIHTHKTAHACNICNLNLCVRSLHIHVEYFLLKNRTKYYSCWNGKTESLRRDKYMGWRTDTLHTQPGSCGLYTWAEQDTCTALPGTWLWASLPPARTQPTGQGPNWGDFSKVGEVMGKRRWGRGSYTATAVRPV